LPLEPESGRAHKPEEKKTFSRKIKSDDKGCWKNEADIKNRAKIDKGAREKHDPDLVTKSCE
jgi:hypothetical protein